MTKDNKIVKSGNQIFDWQDELVDQLVLSKEEDRDYILCLNIAKLISELDESEKIEELLNDTENVLNPEEVGEEYAIYREYNFSIMLEPYTDNLEENIYKVKFENKEGIATEDIAYIPMKSDKLGAIKRFNNGYIPFYSYQNRAPGWCDYEGNVVYLDQRFEILEVYDDIVVLRIVDGDYCIFSTHNWERRLTVKEVTLCDNGYIIKQYNDKATYIDKNLNQITDEYDYLQIGTKNVLIATNILDDGKKETFLVDINGNRLSEETFDAIKTNDGENFKNIQKGEKLENNSVMKDVDYTYRLKLN